MVNIKTAVIPSTITTSFSYQRFGEVYFPQVQHYTLDKLVENFFIIKPTRCTNFTNLFWHETLHVSDSSSVHHEEFIHCKLSNGICHTGL